jgi:hypothetical protein
MKVRFIVAYIIAFSFCTFLPERICAQDTLRAVMHTKNSDGLLSDSAKPLLCDKHGNVWALFQNKGVGFFNRKSWTFFDKSNGLSSTSITDGFTDSAGNVWFGDSQGGISVFNGTAWIHIDSPSGTAPGAGLMHVFSQKDGATWFLCRNNWKWTGIGYYKDGAWTCFDSTNGLAGSIIRSACLDEKNNSVWIAYETKGAGLYDGKTWKNFSTKDGLFNDTVSSLTINSKGQALLAHNFSKYNYDYSGCGYSYYNGRAWTKASSGLINKTCVDAKGDIWFGFEYNYGDYYIGRFHDDSLTKFTDSSLPFQNYAVGQFAPASDGTLWIQYTLDNNGSALYDGQKFHQYTKDYLGHFDIDYDASGHAWASYNNFDVLPLGTRQYGISRFNGTAWEYYSEKDGLANMAFCNRHHDKKGNTFGCYGSEFTFGSLGLAFFDGSKWSGITTSNKLLSNDINYITLDSMDNPWVYYAKSDSGVGCLYNGKWFNFSKTLGNLPANGIHIVHMSNGETWGSFDNNTGLVQITTDSLMNVPVGINENIRIKRSTISSVAIKNGILIVSGIQGTSAILTVFTVNGKRALHTQLKCTDGNVHFRIPENYKKQLMIINLKLPDQCITKSVLF